MLPISEEYLRGVRQLVRQSALSHTDWLKLIEARRALIEPHLNTMDLKPIGKVRVMGYSKDDRCFIEPGDPEVIASQPELSLATRCYYPMGNGFYSDVLASSVEFEFKPPGSSPAVGGEERFWALARSGKWLMVTATVEFPKTTSRPTGYPIERARVSKVIIAETDVPDIISRTKTTPKGIWDELGKLARQWHARRSELLHDAERLAEIFDFEDNLLCYVRK